LRQVRNVKLHGAFRDVELGWRFLLERRFRRKKRIEKRGNFLLAGG